MQIDGATIVKLLSIRRRSGSLQPRRIGRNGGQQLLSGGAFCDPVGYIKATGGRA
ncbi:hypothetical protein H8F24_17825 [Synechococcus sp. CBW1002]|uniref:hypothetical protein n=1 Tax=Synechococcus sp. CBW1002 TaxID=1353134 RepID=UPI0018CD67BE|nr:hypothetical protein [Synechococcus sp. CBW1002]QPN59776.1 hypothetical protein H8F24_17825 [Synechococcus sp. CBW1002]